MSGSPDRGEKGDAGRDDMDEFAEACRLLRGTMWDQSAAAWRTAGCNV